MQGFKPTLKIKKKKLPPSTQHRDNPKRSVGAREFTPFESMTKHLKKKSFMK